MRSSRSEHWERLSDSGWKRLAEDWLEANREPPSSDAEYDPVDMIVTQMKFDAPPEKLWEFILLSASLAETDWQFSMIGIELIEHILGWYGEEFIYRLEAQAPTNEALARTLTGLLPYMMSDEVYRKLKELEAGFRDRQ